MPQLQQTCCVALSGHALKYGEAFDEGGRKGKRCMRDDDGRILARDKADWCSSKGGACTPPEADAFRLEAMFATRAVATRADRPAGGAG